MELFVRVGCRGPKNLRRLILALVLACLISLEMPDVSVVRAQEVPGLYANAQETAGNYSWVSQIANPFAALFPGQQVIFPANRPQGFSFSVEGLYMNLRTDAQVFAQDVSTTYLGNPDSVTGDFHSVKPDRVQGVKVGLGYTTNDWDARVLYTRYRAKPRTDHAGPGEMTSYLGASTNPYAATLPVASLNTMQAEAGFSANLWDFQAGYSIRLGRSRTARVYGGISYVETQNTLDGTGDLTFSGSLALNRNTRYRAWGPKVGLDLNCPIGGSRVGVHGSGSVGGLFGTEKLNVDNTVSGVPNQYEETNRHNVISLEGEAGIGYAFPGMEVTLGYRIERYSVNNLRYLDVSASFSPNLPRRLGKRSAVQYLDGVFLRIDAKL